MKDEKNADASKQRNENAQTADSGGQSTGPDAVVAPTGGPTAKAGEQRAGGSAHKGHEHATGVAGLRAAGPDAHGVAQKKAIPGVAKAVNHDSGSGVVASVEYVRGHRHAIIAPEDIAGYKRDPDHLLWTGLKDPSDDELRMTCKNLSFSKLATKEIVKRHFRPKVIDYGNYILIVAVTISRQNKKIVYGEMQMIFGQSFILTVRRGEAMSNTPLRNRLEDSPDLIARGSDFVVAEILDGLADSYLALTSGFEQDVEQLEQKMILHGFRDSDVRKLYRLRRDLLRVHTSIAPVIEICSRMSVVNLAFVEPDSQGYYRIVADRVARIDDQINALRESLAFAFEASQMIAQAHQTDITKKLASWAAILAVPTAIAGIYGMNFTNMPEINWAYGYPLVMLLMFLICGLLFRQFRKTGWL
ncbi:magnesium transporter [Advenella sp. S44]|uniref:magnesium and cobalt transport protein CorA n=1 Tax=Advenella sp. S44 TaxID=1982755 RepID=UPI000C2A57D0|nr:magnesium and cobalt transport protein CorA [Advenella sp. S44]PJX22196.1 magnesium transporter [Advenella sp. S44]